MNDDERATGDILLEILEREPHFGDPDGDNDGLDRAAEKDALPLFVEAVKKLYSHATVWACKQVGSREYSTEEVEAMMREENPEWFDEPQGQGDTRGR